MCKNVFAHLSADLRVCLSCRRFFLSFISVGGFCAFCVFSLVYMLLYTRSLLLTVVVLVLAMLPCVRDEAGVLP